MKQQIWDQVKVPIGVVQIVRNIMESPDEYNKLAQYMNKNGYIVCCAGDDAADFDDAVQSQKNILARLKKQYVLPVYLVGHKYGGIIAQEIIRQSDDCMGAICVSCTRYPTTRCVLAMAAIMAWIGAKIRGKNARAFIVNAWDNRDQPTMSYGFYHSLFKNLVRGATQSSGHKPLLIIGNGNDVTKINGKLAQTLYNAYNVQDLNNLTLIVYPDVKTNLIRSETYTDVQQDILDFIRNRNIRY